MLSVIPALGTGCDASNGAGTTELGVIVARSNTNTQGIWINNGLSDPDVSGIDPAHPLSSPQGMSETEGVLADADTQLAAVYVVECALPLGSSIVKSVDGQPLVLSGHVGLAPEWEDGACDEDCQQWVTACLLARTNVSMQSIPISLRADHPALGFDGNSDYPIYEASFFGNLFVAPQGQYMCEGSEEAAVMAELDGRTCSIDPESCGFESYADCELAERCELVGEDDEVTAVDCVPEGSNTTYRTISAYVMEPDGHGGNGNGNGGCHGNGNGNGH